MGKNIKKINLDISKDKTPYGKTTDSINYWTKNRNKFKDLYRSEKYFFSKVITDSHSFLDIGCAAGGFFKILKQKKKKLKYTGLDVSKNLIKLAKKNNINGKFILYRGNSFNTKIRKADLVFSFGTLHHNKNVINLINEMIKKSKKYILFDLRLTKSKIGNKFMIKNYQKVFFTNTNQSNNTIPYYILNFNKFFEKLLRITKKKYAISFYGYNHKPNSKTVTKFKSIIMGSILIEKRKKFNLSIKI